MAHLAPSLAEQDAALNARLQSVQANNARLLDSIMQQRHQIEGLVSGLETAIADLDAANTALPHDDLVSLTQDTVALDADLRMTG